MTDQLFPRQPRRMLQPRKAEIRHRLELLSAQIAFDSTPLWWRLWHRVWVRIVEVDPEIRELNKAIRDLKFLQRLIGVSVDRNPPHRNPPPPQTEPGELL